MSICVIKTSFDMKSEIEISNNPFSMQHKEHDKWGILVSMQHYEPNKWNILVSMMNQ